MFIRATVDDWATHHDLHGEQDEVTFKVRSYVSKYVYNMHHSLYCAVR